MNEKPSTIEASGTSEESVSVRLKIRRQTKMRSRSERKRSTASSFATVLPTSWVPNHS